MNRRHEAKNDFFYGLVMFVMFAVVVFNIAVAFTSAIQSQISGTSTRQ
jgi:hypothetical protein